MKKLSSLLVLMLIALMLFVSCNNSTPTKEEPAKEEPAKEEPAKEEPAKLEERDAKTEDLELASKIFYAVSYLERFYGSDNIEKVELNNGTYTFSEEGCSFEVTEEVLLGSIPEYEVTLFGSVTKKGIAEDTLEYTCDFKDGTIIDSHTVKAKITSTVNSNGSAEYEVQEPIIIDGKKVNKLAEMLNADF